MAEIEMRTFEPEDNIGEFNNARSVMDVEEVRTAEAATEASVREVQQATTDEAVREAQKAYDTYTVEEAVQILNASNIRIEINAADLRSFQDLFSQTDAAMGDKNPTLREFEQKGRS